jgi:hypothetical protein
MRFEHYAIANETLHIAAQDAGGYQMQHGLLAIYDKRMPGIMATLKPHDCSCALREEIDNLAFAFITPLSAYDYYITSHRLSCPLRQFIPTE